MWLWVQFPAEYKEEDSERKEEEEHNDEIMHD
jgi:hypothetical protein